MLGCPYLRLAVLSQLRGVGVSHVLLETTMGLVNSGNSVLHTITIYEGYIRHAIFHSSGRGLAEGFTKILTEQGFSFTATMMKETCELPDENIIVVPNVSVL